MSYKTMSNPARPPAIDRATSPDELWKMFEKACEQNEQMLDTLRKNLATFNETAVVLGLLGRETTAEAMLIAATYTANVIAKVEGR